MIAIMLEFFILRLHCKISTCNAIHDFNSNKQITLKVQPWIVGVTTKSELGNFSNAKKNLRILKKIQKKVQLFFIWPFFFEQKFNWFELFFWEIVMLSRFMGIYFSFIFLSRFIGIFNFGSLHFHIRSKHQGQLPYLLTFLECI